MKEIWQEICVAILLCLSIVYLLRRFLIKKKNINKDKNQCSNCK